MTDRETVALAAYAVAGAWLSRGPSPVVGGIAVVVALVVRRPWLLCVAATLLASGLGWRSLDGLHPPALGAYTGTVTLLSDPVDRGGAVRVEVRAGGKHLDAHADGQAAIAALGDRLAGERVTVEGTIEPLPTRARWLESRHIVGRLSIESVTAVSEGPPVVRLANGLRRTLDRGAGVLAGERRALFLGVVLGDDRDVSPVVTDDFRGAGLTHLTVVSGMNVALVLTLAGPLLRRLTAIWRLAATIAVIAFFAVVTRFEPSVLRASAMAAIAALAFTFGREASGLRCLSLAVTALVLVDPLLVQAVGFQLSVAASAGILVLARPIAGWLPGPKPVAAALAVTVAAQLGVSPLLVASFGGLPLASVPANLLAVPAVVLVRVWGLTAGVVAGWFADVGASSVARVVHAPTALLTGWLQLVARQMAALPFGELGANELVVVVGGALIALLAARWRRRGAACCAVVVAAVGLVAPAVALRVPPPPYTQLSPGAGLWRLGDASVLVLDRRVRTDDLLVGLRRGGVNHVDLLVVRNGGTAMSPPVAAATTRTAPGLIVAPPAAHVSGAATLDRTTTFVVGRAAVTIAPASGDLRVLVEQIG